MAAIVPPVEARVRFTLAGLQGNPMVFMCSSESCPVRYLVEQTSVDYMIRV
jgi:hypothetical protein